MNIAITGGTGFIGRHLAQAHINQGHNVKILSRSQSDIFNKYCNVKLFNSDLNNKSILRCFIENTDILYHCAAESVIEADMALSNVGGIKQLLSVAKDQVGRWVQLSSASIYESNRFGVITESTPEKIDNLYEYTKQLADLLLTEYSSINSMEYTIVRPTKVFGPGMNNLVLYKLFNLIKKNLFFYIDGGIGSANYIYIDNLVNAKAVGETFIVSDSMKMNEFVVKIAQILEVSPPRFSMTGETARLLANLTSFIPNNPLTLQRVNAMVRSASYSSDKIINFIGYHHEVSIEKGLEMTVNDWRNSS